MNKIGFLKMAILSLSLAGCAAAAPSPVDDGGYTNISVKTLEKMIEERRESFILVNTHIPFEGDIPGTDLSIPYDEILENLDKFPQEKDAEIVLYCRNDPMSNAAAADLVQAGYSNVKNLVGGFNAWREAGQPLEMVP